jgi:hypothetical protein
MITSPCARHAMLSMLLHTEVVGRRLRRSTYRQQLNIGSLRVSALRETIVGVGIQNQFASG